MTGGDCFRTGEMIATVDVIDDVHASPEEGIIADWAARIAQGVESSVCRFANEPTILGLGV